MSGKPQPSNLCYYSHCIERFMVYQGTSAWGSVREGRKGLPPVLNMLSSRRTKRKYSLFICKEGVKIKQGCLTAHIKLNRVNYTHALK